MDRSKVFDTGFTVVYDPDESITDSPPVDIVLIHGLQGHPYRTWTYVSSEPQSNNTPSRLSSATSTSNTKRSIGRKLLGSLQYLKKKRPGKVRPASTQAISSMKRPGSPAKGTLSIFWPADLLPKTCPKARILVWGYDTEVARPLGEAVNKSGLFSQGKDLLFAFRRERRLNVPVIFVVHSLGGIVLKEALIGSYHSGETDLENIAKSTKAVIFMGTPHRGSKDMAGVGDVARRVASAFMIDTNSAMLDSLGLKNSDMERAQDSFTRIWQKIGFKIKTFQEGLPLSGFNLGFLNEKVVPDFSSLLGDPREHAETLQANHMDMCRFHGQSDPNYRKVGGELSSIYRSVINMASNLTSESDAQPERYRHTGSNEEHDDRLQQYRDVRSRLYFPQIGQRQLTIETALNNTCLYLLHSRQYEDWLHRRSLDQHDCLLWIKGKPGSGKSTLLKEAMTQASMLPTSHGRYVVGFFFNARGHELEKSPVGFFRSLLWQLLPLFRERMHVFTDLGTHQTPDDVTTWDLQQLKNNVRAMFDKPCGRPIFIFVDALDECVGDGPRDIIQFLRDLSMNAYYAAIDLNICMSSRHYPTVTISGYIELVMEDYNSPDIAQFVKRKLSMTISGASSRDVKHWIHIQNEIIQRASGVFLWARLVLDLLLAEYDKGKSIRSLEARVASVPQQLGDLYTQILRGINPKERDQAAKLFSWILLSVRPIQLREWYQLLAFTSEDIPRSLAKWRRSDTAIDNDDQLLRRVQHLSRGLVEVREPRWAGESIFSNGESDSILAVPGSLQGNTEGFGTFQFIHESVREFFLNLGGFEILRPNASENTIGQAHLSIMATCFDYLAIKELDELVVGRLNAPASDASSSCSYPMARFLLRGLFDPHYRGISHSHHSFSDEIESSSASVETRSLQRQRSIASARSFWSSASHVGSSASNYARSTASISFGANSRHRANEGHSSAWPTENTNLGQNEAVSESGAPLEVKPSPLHEIWGSESRSIDLKHSSLDQFCDQMPGSDDGVEVPPLARSNNDEFTSEANFAVSPMTEPGDQISLSEDFADVSPIGESVKSRGRVIEEIPCFLYYAAGKIVDHAISAEVEGCDPSGLIRRLQDENSWERWVALCEDMPTGTSLLTFAAEHGLSSWVSCLLQASTDAAASSVNLELPLEAAAREGRKEILHLLLQKVVGLNVGDHAPRTFLQILTIKSNHAILEEILEQYSFDINGTDVWGRTLLHLAARWSNLETVSLFIYYGADPNSLDSWEDTPLHYSIFRKDPDENILLCLTAAGADALRRNRDGLTPFSMARLNGYHKTAEIFQPYMESLEARLIAPTLPDTIRVDRKDTDTDSTSASCNVWMDTDSHERGLDILTRTEHEQSVAEVLTGLELAIDTS